MIKATKEELKLINERYNDVKEDVSIGTDYYGEGAEIINFEIDDNGRITMEVEVTHLNSQYGLRSRYHTRHPKFTSEEIYYLFGKLNTI